MSQIKLTADSGGGTTSIKAPSSTTSNADVVLKLPVADGSANQVLKTDGSGQLSFTSNAGTTINNNADNRVITGSGTANTLEGESNLTFNGTGELLITGTNHVTQIMRAGGSTSDLQIQFKDSSGNIESAIFCASDSGDLRFQTGGSNERMRIRSSGEVHIGTIVSGNDRGAAAIKAVNDHAGNPMNVYFQEVSGGEGYGIGIDSDGDLNFHNSASTTPTLEIRDDNNVAVTTGNLIIGTSGKGIDFSATSDYTGAGSGTPSELLDDYEEGTFTPRFQTSNGNWGGSMSSQNGSYTKIGNVVHVTFRLHWGSVSGSGNFRITALPFTVKNVTSNQGGPVIGVRSGFNYARLTSYWLQNNQQLQFQYVDGQGSYGSFDLSVGAIASTGYVYCSGWYETA